MNYIRHLTGFFERVAKDRLLNPSHIAVYMALFQFWNLNRFRNPISISRDELMRISRISSNATYHKCLKHLHAQGYIRYEPSYNPYRGSHVIMFNFADDLKPDTSKSPPVKPNFEPVGEQVLNKQETSTVQVGEQVVYPSINNTNTTNNQNSVNGDTLAQNSDHENFELDVGEEKEKEKLREKKKEDLPSLEQVSDFFESEKFPSPEAHKFFNYYQSIGWLVGGKTPMASWQAAARNWMLNAPKYETHDTITPNTIRHLDTSAEKDYAEPL